MGSVGKNWGQGGGNKWSRHMKRSRKSLVYLRNRMEAETEQAGRYRVSVTSER